MHRTILYPSQSRFLPSQEIRDQALMRNSKYKLRDFETLEDWFFYTHVDPVQRMIHAIGMFIGLSFFGLCSYFLFSENWPLTALFYLLGVFFYYVSGIISHQFYDAGTGRSRPKDLITTFIPVIKINLATTFGSYDDKLRAFIAKYPFVTEAYQLIEVRHTRRYEFLRGLSSDEERE